MLKLFRYGHILRVTAGCKRVMAEMNIAVTRRVNPFDLTEFNPKCI